MADLEQLLIAGSRGDRDAEARLKEYEATNYPELTKALAAEIGTDGKPVEARTAACLYLKNTLNAKSATKQNEFHERWKIMDPATRSLVKDTLLAALRSQVEGIPRFAAIAASEVACVELPYQEWPNFVPAMTEALSSPDAPESVKLASLDCLGMTCERIDEVQAMLPEVPDLVDATVNSLLTTIVQGVQPERSDALRYSALQALNKSLSFVHKNMEVPAERDFIMKNAICGATQSSEGKVRQLAFQCLDIVAELYYDKLQDYMTHIYELTTTAIKQDAVEDVKMAAIEFWCTVAGTEENLILEEDPSCKRYVESAMPTLVPLLLETLSKQDETMDEDNFDLRAVGAICLEAISMAVHEKIIPVVIPFVHQHIGSDNWHLRDAAIVAFSCILDGPSTASIGQFVQQSIPVLMSAFAYQNDIVRDSATHCIANICKLHIEAVPQEQVHTIIQGLMGKLKENPRLAGRACSAIFNISASLKTPDPEHMPESNLLSAPMFPLMQALLESMDRPDAAEGNLRVSAMSAAAELVTASARDVQHLLRGLVPVVVSRVENALRMEVLSNDDAENKAQMLGLLSGLVTALFQRLEKQDVLPQVDSVMTVLLQVLQVQNANCHEEAFLAIGAIATSLEEDFVRFLPNVMPLLITGLRSFQELQLCMVSVGVVVDICGAVGGQIQPFCDEIMGALTDCLRDSTAHRDTKPPVFSCFGDIAMAIGAAFEPYLQVSTMLLMQAAQAQIQPDDEDLVDFINRLRLSILDAYTGIIMGLSDGQALHLFAPNVASIMQFLQFLSTPQSYKDDLCLQKAVGLVGDIAQQMGQDQHIRQQINQPFVSQLVQQASTSSEEPTRDIAGWTSGVVRQVISV